VNDDYIVGAVLTLMLAFCIAAPCAVWAASRQPKEKKRTTKDDYPDDHLFV